MSTPLKNNVSAINFLKITLISFALLFANTACRDGDTDEITSLVAEDRETADGTLVNDISFVTESLRFRAGETYQLDVNGTNINQGVIDSIHPDRADFLGHVSWSSDDESILTVSNSGLITGVAASTNNVTVTATYKKFSTAYSDTLLLSVSDEPVTSIAITSAEGNSNIACIPQQYTAVATYQDLVTSDITDRVSSIDGLGTVWAFTPDADDTTTAIASNTTKGLFTATGGANDTYIFTATYEGISETTSTDFSVDRLSSLQILKGDPEDLEDKNITFEPEEDKTLPLWALMKIDEGELTEEEFRIDPLATWSVFDYTDTTNVIGTVDNLGNPVLDADNLPIPAPSERAQITVTDTTVTLTAPGAGAREITEGAVRVEATCGGKTDDITVIVNEDDEKILIALYDDQGSTAITAQTNTEFDIRLILTEDGEAFDEGDNQTQLISSITQQVGQTDDVIDIVWKEGDEDIRIETDNNDTGEATIEVVYNGVIYRMKIIVTDEVIEE